MAAKGAGGRKKRVAATPLNEVSDQKKVNTPKRGLPAKRERPKLTMGNMDNAAPAGAEEVPFQFTAAGGRAKSKKPKEAGTRKSPRAHKAAQKKNAEVPEKEKEEEEEEEEQGNGYSYLIKLVEQLGQTTGKEKELFFKHLRDPMLAKLRLESGIEEPEPVLSDGEAESLAAELELIEAQQSVIEKEKSALIKRASKKTKLGPIEILPEHQALLDACQDPLTEEAYNLEIIQHFALVQDFVRQVEHLERMHNGAQSVLETYASDARGDVVTPRRFIKGKQ